MEQHVLRFLCRANDADERSSEVGAVFGALPDGFSQNQVEVRGEVDPIIKNLRRWVITLGYGRVSLETVLARGSGVGTQGAFFLTIGMAKVLGRAISATQERRKESQTNV